MSEPSETKPDPLSGARARGDHYKQLELASAENLTSSEAAERIGLSEAWVNTLRQRGELYALFGPDRESEFRYPAWQFDCHRERLSTILKALSKAGVDQWGVHVFMNNASKGLQGRTPRDYILDSGAPLAEVLVVLERRYVDEQGAQ